MFRPDTVPIFFKNPNPTIFKTRIRNPGAGYNTIPTSVCILYCKSDDYSVDYIIVKYIDRPSVGYFQCLFFWLT